MAQKEELESFKTKKGKVYYAKDVGGYPRVTDKKEEADIADLGKYSKNGKPYHWKQVGDRHNYCFI